MSLHSAGPVRPGRSSGSSAVWGNFALLLATSAVCAAVLYGVAGTGWGQARIGELRRRGAVRPQGKAVGIWRPDARLGFSHVASMAGTHETADFSVRYTIDETGCRSTPKPTHHRGSVLFLGDSFTFGHGVEDAQPYPAVLAEFWPHVKVRNCAVMGWSTGQAYLALERELAAPVLPRAVVYAWTTADLRRNYLRQSWLSALGDYGLRNAHFELQDHGVRYRGTVGPEGGIPDGTPRLDEQETRITRALIRDMDRLCAQRSVRFIVALLATRDPDDTMGDWLAQEGPRNGIAVLDLRGVRGPYFKNDGHPKPVWHRTIASSFAQDATGLIGIDTPVRD